MKAQDRYLKFVRWEEADGLYVGLSTDSRISQMDGGGMEDFRAAGGSPWRCTAIPRGGTRPSEGESRGSGAAGRFGVRREGMEYRFEFDHEFEFEAGDPPREGTRPANALAGGRVPV